MPQADPHHRRRAVTRRRTDGGHALPDEATHGHALADAPALPEPEKADVWGMMGEFETPAELYHACEKLRDAGYKEFDAHTPFPVHGLEKAHGPATHEAAVDRRSSAASPGCPAASLLTWYVNWSTTRSNISGKPVHAARSTSPIYFELTILLCALGHVLRHAGAEQAADVLPPDDAPQVVRARRPTTASSSTIEATDPKYDARRDEDAAREARRAGDRRGARREARASCWPRCSCRCRRLPRRRAAKIRRSTWSPDMDSARATGDRRASSNVFADGRADRTPDARTIARDEPGSPQHLKLDDAAVPGRRCHGKALPRRAVRR